MTDRQIAAARGEGFMMPGRVVPLALLHIRAC